MDDRYTIDTRRSEHAERLTCMVITQRIHIGARVYTEGWAGDTCVLARVGVRRIVCLSTCWYAYDICHRKPHNGPSHRSSTMADVPYLRQCGIYTHGSWWYSWIRVSIPGLTHKALLPFHPPLAPDSRPRNKEVNQHLVPLSPLFCTPATCYSAERLPLWFNPSRPWRGRGAGGFRKRFQVLRGTANRCSEFPEVVSRCTELPTSQRTIRDWFSSRGKGYSNFDW